jgi:hypothetical protein
MLQDPEKVYQASLDKAYNSIDSARAANEAGRYQEAIQIVESVAEDVESALATLEAMPKPAYKNHKNYKRAEIRTREILRRLDTFINDCAIDEREAMQPHRARINKVHDKLLAGVMSKKP